jgi:pimeloyl-ACP methyl ester carboxylesterase
MRTVQRRTVVIDRSALSVLHGGDGPPVLLHPSLGRGADDFADLAASLVDAGHRVVAVDPRGIGASAPAPGGLTLERIADDLVAVADVLGIDRFAAVGHAFGNRVVRMAATRHPDRIDVIVLLGAGGKVPGDPEARAAVGRCFGSTLTRDERLAAIATAFFAPGNDPSVWLDGWYPEGKAVQQAALVGATTDDWWHANDAPMLVVQGLQDRAAPPENGRLLARDRPAPTTLVEVDGAGHALLPEQPDAVRAAVLPFLATHTGRS